MSRADWYSRRLNQQTPRAPLPPALPPPVLPSTHPTTQQYQQPQQEQQRIDPKQDLIGAMSQYEGGAGARNAQTCPDCGSPHFFQPTPNTARRCYGCGWTDRFGQRGVAQ